jgi:hypothetical protein
MHDEYAQATVSAGACGCGCNMTTQPTCDVGTLAMQWAQGLVSPNSPCPNQGESVTLAGSGCTQLPTAGQLQPGFSAEPVILAGGACAGVVKPDPTKLSKPAVRYCDVPSASAAAVCAGTPPSGFSTCIVADGNVACPAGPFTMQLEVDDDDELVCPSCDMCAVTGSCGSPQVTFFSDGTCRNVVATLPCNSRCGATPALSGSNDVVAIEYAAQVQSGCAATASGAPGVSPSGPHTLCCR